jgi:curved DNA-binding protein
MDYYSILGVKETAQQEEIKKAYKKLAMKHHPDRGGDTKTFQEITQAYETLSDPEKRSQYDAERKYGGTQFHFTSDNPFDPFGQMFGGQNPFEQFFRGGARPQRPRARNRDLNIRCTITFKQSYTGTELEANYQLPTGKKQTVVIKVPAGVQSGQVIRYQGMGDDSVADLPRGDLMVTIMVEASKDYERRGDDLVAYLTINPFEAMSGCSKIVNLLDDSSVRINLHPGVQYGTEYLSKGKGFRNLAGYIGNLIIQVRIDIPAVTDKTHQEKLLNLYAEISNLTKSNS